MDLAAYAELFEPWLIDVERAELLKKNQTSITARETGRILWAYFEEFQIRSDSSQSRPSRVAVSGKGLKRVRLWFDSYASPQLRYQLLKTQQLPDYGRTATRHHKQRISSFTTLNNSNSPQST